MTAGALFSDSGAIRGTYYGAGPPHSYARSTWHVLSSTGSCGKTLTAPHTRRASSKSSRLG
eukprot:12473711-Heterocapsa_arctica.AAC.1